jgi:hypothetical protein
MRKKYFDFDVVSNFGFFESGIKSPKDILHNNLIQYFQEVILEGFYINIVASKWEKFESYILDGWLTIVC